MRVYCTLAVAVSNSLKQLHISCVNFETCILSLFFARLNHAFIDYELACTLFFISHDGQERLRGARVLLLWPLKDRQSVYDHLRASHDHWHRFVRCGARHQLLGVANQLRHRTVLRLRL